MKNNNNTQLTTIHIDSYLYKQFKIRAVIDDISLKDFVTEALHAYITGSLKVENLGFSIKLTDNN